MVQPLNYMMNVADPMARTLQGYQQGIDAQTALAQRQLAQEAGQRAQEMQPFAVRQAELGVQSQEQALAAQQEQLQRQKAFRDAMGGLIGLGADATYEDVAGVVQQFPEMQSAVLESYNALDEVKKKPLLRSIAQSAAALKAGNPEVAKKIADDFATAAENSGDASLAAQARAISQMIDVDPNVALAQAGVLLQTMDKDVAKYVLGTGTAKVQRSIPVGDGSVTALIMNDGTTRYQDTASGKMLEGADADSAVAAAQAGEIEQARAKAGGTKTGTLEAEIALGSEAAAEKAKGTVIGKSIGERMTAAPGVIAQSEQSLELIKSVRDDPALAGVTGRIEGRLPEWTYSQDEQDLLVKIKQIRGKAFLEAFETLKGGGQITEIEGEKAEQAMARLERVQSLPAYQAALDDLIGVIEIGMKRARGELPMPVAGDQQATTQQKPDFVLQADEILKKRERGEPLTAEDYPILQKASDWYDQNMAGQ